MICRVIMKSPHPGDLGRFTMTQVTEGGVTRFVLFEADTSRMPGIVWLRVR